jgi:hypothetical protein
VFEIICMVCCDAMEKDKDKDREAFAAMLDTLFDAPVAPPTDCGQYHSDLCGAVLGHLHTLGVLRNGDRHQKMLGALPLLAGAMADRATISIAMPLSSSIQGLQGLLRTVIDDAGDVHSFVERALGRTLTTEIVRSMFLSLNRLHFLLLTRAVTSGTEGLTAAVVQTCDAVPMFLLGHANPEEPYVFCLCHIAMEHSRKGGQPPSLVAAWRRLWRLIFTCRHKAITALTRRKFDVAYASDDELDAEVARLDALREQTSRVFTLQAERVAALIARSAKRPVRRPTKVGALCCCFFVCCVDLFKSLSRIAPV